MSDLFQNMSDIFFICSHGGIKNWNPIFTGKHTEVCIPAIVFHFPATAEQYRTKHDCPPLHAAPHNRAQKKQALRGNFPLRRACVSTISGRLLLPNV